MKRALPRVRPTPSCWPAAEKIGAASRYGVLPFEGGHLDHHRCDKDDPTVLKLANQGVTFTRAR